MLASFIRIRYTPRLLYHNFSSSSEFYANQEEANDLAKDFGFENHYSPDENDKILKTINRGSMLDMKNFSISQGRSKRIVKRREIIGDFKSIEELLEIEGFGINILEKFCDSIVKNVDIKLAEKRDQELPKNLKRQSFVSPTLLEIVRNKINSIVSFHIDLDCLAWTKINYLPKDTTTAAGRFYVEEWRCHEVENFDNEKLNLPSMSQLLVQLTDQVPQADAYVIEAMPTFTANKALKNKRIKVINLQKAQYYAMLCALVSARKKNNIHDDHLYLDNVYFLKTFLSSRFYKFSTGNGQFEAKQIMDLIFAYNAMHVQEKPNFESIDVPKKLQAYFKSMTASEQEHLADSMLVGLSFMKLCVQKCTKCVDLINEKKMFS